MTTLARDASAPSGASWPIGGSVSTTPAGASRPGMQVGPTSEFSLFFHVLPDHADELRQSLRELQDTPGYRPGDYGMADRDDP